jgi:cell division protein FtsQ
MGRETRTSGLPSNTRRNSHALDPNRSAMRRASTRRNTLSRPPPLLREVPNTPRNRRVLRTPPPERTGPSWTTRLLQAVVGAARSTAGAVTGSARGASTKLARVAGPATSALRLLMVVAFLGGAVLLGRFVQRHLTTAPAFAVDQIEVSGLARLDRAELLEAAGLRLGLNVFARAPEEIRARLLRHPWILSAEVQRRLPSRIEIAVREREPVALLVVEPCAPTRAGSRQRGEPDPACDEPSALYLISDEARMFKRLTGKDPVDLPVITGVTRERIAGDPDFSRRVLVDAVALLSEYRNAGLKPRSAIGELHVEANDGFSLYVGEDLTYVRLGAPPFTQKLQRLKRVFERLEREQARAEYVYLDNEKRPERVTVRLR